ncbi:MAG: sialidase family protein [Gelidibacter sp.]
MMNKLLTLLIAVFLFNCGVKTQTKTTTDGAPVFQDLFNTSMTEGVQCYRIPAIVTAPNGDVIAAIDERVPNCGDLKYSNDINIIVRRSSDNGKTWSNIETVVNFPYGQSASDPSMIVDEVTKEIFLFYNFMNLETEKDIYYLHVVKSADNGKTWSQPEDITPYIAKSEWKNDFKFITSGRGIQTRSGKLLHTMVNLNSGLHLFGSDDHGKTWYFIDAPIQPADESKVIELTDGTLMINARVNKGGMRYVHRSTDEGKTWTTTPAPELIDPGCNASIIRYTDTKDGYDKNRLLFSNAKSEKGRVNMTVRISYDEGVTWSEGKTIYEGPSAYSDMTILDNGDIGLFFEQDEYTKNPFVYFSLDWLTDGKDVYKKSKK